jgi:hypothetical protein
MARHFVDIAGESVEVKRQVLAERSNGKPEDSSDPVSE